MKRDKFQEIDAARKVLQLPQAATMAEIKENYRRLLGRWHPDRNEQDSEECAEMTRKIIAAYQTILNYCQHYAYSFAEETVKTHQTPEDWWFERFGDQALWGNSSKRK